MLCVICAKAVPQTTDMNPWCSPGCGVKWRARQPFLFKDLKSGGAPPEFSGTNLIAAAMQGMNLDDNSLRALQQVSTALRPLAIEQEVGAGFHKPAKHFQQKQVTEDVPREVPDKWSEKRYDRRTGKAYWKTVHGTKTVIDKVRKTVTEETAIDRDRMLEIAIMAYNTAVGLRSKNKPVILYRIAGKSTLTEDEHMQTLSASVRARVITLSGASKEVWPIEKTAAWIQGAMRARVPFVLLNDPRENLVGGVDKKSDAIYVRELHQITSTRYTIAKCELAMAPKAHRDKGILPFVLLPPAMDVGALPLLPRMSAATDWDMTWDGSKSSLTIGDPERLVRDHLTLLFTEAGSKCGVPLYPAKTWNVD